jgi:hypothetical protein
MVVLDFARAPTQNANSARVWELQMSAAPTFHRDVAYGTHMDVVYTKAGTRVAAKALNAAIPRTSNSRL